MLARTLIPFGMKRMMKVASGAGLSMALIATLRNTLNDKPSLIRMVLWMADLSNWQRQEQRRSSPLARQPMNLNSIVILGVDQRFKNLA